MSQLHTLKNWKTLLIERDSLIRDSLSLAFKVSGSYLWTAPTVESGLQMLETVHFDIHLCDLRFPTTDGLDFFRRASIRCPKALNVIMGSSWNEYLIKKAQALGVQYFIQKPFSVETLLQSLPCWAEARQQAYHRASDAEAFTFITS